MQTTGGPKKIFAVLSRSVNRTWQNNPTCSDLRRFILHLFGCCLVMILHRDGAGNAFFLYVVLAIVLVLATGPWDVLAFALTETSSQASSAQR